MTNSTSISLNHNTNNLWLPYLNNRGRILLNPIAKIAASM